MKIELKELRRIVRTIIKEASPVQRPTISSDLDPNEKELSARHPNWGSSRAKEKSVSSPASVKAKQVAKILAATGVTSDASNKKKVVHELLPFIEKMDPQEMFISDPEEIATEFAQKILGVNPN